MVSPMMFVGPKHFGPLCVNEGLTFVKKLIRG
jgi:hypothetical protein